MDVSIIIINYNTKELTKSCINSVFEKTKEVDFEVILVDNASTDGSKEVFEQDKRIKYIYNTENVGFGRANNIGLTIALGKHIFFLNSDTVLINNAIKILSEGLDKDVSLGACGGNLYKKDMTPNISYEMNFPSIIKELDSLLFYIPSKMIGFKRNIFNDKNKVIEVAYISGADLMVKKKVLTEVGAFDPDFFMYFEETELCFRIKKHGYKIVSIPNAKIIHLSGQSSKQNKSKKPSKFYFDSKIIFINKTYKNYLTRLLFIFIAKLNVRFHSIIGKW